MSIFIPKYKIQVLIPKEVRQTSLDLLKQNRFPSHGVKLDRAVGTIDTVNETAEVFFFFASPTISDAQFKKIVKLQQGLPSVLINVLSERENDGGWLARTDRKLPDGMVFLDKESYPKEWDLWLGAIVAEALQ